MDNAPGQHPPVPPGAVLAESRGSRHMVGIAQSGQSTGSWSLVSRVRIPLFTPKAVSSAGRAARSHRAGRRFKPAIAYGRLLKRPTRLDCKSSGSVLHRFESCPCHRSARKPVSSGPSPVILREMGPPCRESLEGGTLARASCARSSAGQSTSLRRKGSAVRIGPGARTSQVAGALLFRLQQPPEQPTSHHQHPVQTSYTRVKGEPAPAGG